MKKIVYFLCFFVLQNAWGQYHRNGDKVYFDERGKTVRKERKTEYYRLYKGDDGSDFYYIEDYFITGKVQFSGKVKKSSSECWFSCTHDGLNIWYKSNGEVSDYKFFSNGILWQGYHSYSLRGKRYEAVFNDGKPTTIHKEENIGNSSSTESLTETVVGVVAIYSLYKLLFGSSSSSSSNYSSCSCSVESLGTKHINGQQREGYNIFTCNSDKLTVVLEKQYDKYYYDGQGFETITNALNKATKAAGCTSWKYK